MGYWTPGKVEFAATAKDIKPATYKTKAYRNILVQVGVNDLKSAKTLTNVNDISDKLIQKCNQIVSLNPKCKLFICPVLPTRDMSLNMMIMRMNVRIQMHVENTLNITVLNCNGFADNRGLLWREFCSRPGDPIHINNVGVSKIVSIVKGHINYMGPYKTRTTRDDGRLYPSVNNVNRRSVNSGVNMMTQRTTSNIHMSHSLQS